MFRRTYRRLRRRYRPRRSFRRGRRLGNSGYKIRRVVRSIAEKKYNDYLIRWNDATPLRTDTFNWPMTMATYAVSNAWRWMTLTSLLKYGTGLDQRVGNKIFLKYVQLSLMFNYAGTEGPAGNMHVMARNGMLCRYIVARDKLCNNGQPPGAGLMQESTPALSADPRNVFTFRAPNQLAKYKILLDRQMKAAVTSMPDAANPEMATTGQQVIQHYIPINRTIRYATDGNDSLTSTLPLVGPDIIIGVVGSIDLCCMLQIRVRLCYQDI